MSQADEKTQCDCRLCVSFRRVEELCERLPEEFKAEVKALTDNLCNELMEESTDLGALTAKLAGQWPAQPDGWYYLHDQGNTYRFKPAEKVGPDESENEGALERKGWRDATRTRLVFHTDPYRLPREMRELLLRLCETAVQCTGDVEGVKPPVHVYVGMGELACCAHVESNHTGFPPLCKLHQSATHDPHRVVSEPFRTQTTRVEGAYCLECGAHLIPKAGEGEKSEWMHSKPEGSSCPHVGRVMTNPSLIARQTIVTQSHHVFYNKEGL